MTMGGRGAERRAVVALGGTVRSSSPGIYGILGSEATVLLMERGSMDRWGVPKQPNAALFLPELEIRRKWWGGPPGPRGAPPPPPPEKQINNFHGGGEPGRGGAAGHGGRPPPQAE